MPEWLIVIIMGVVEGVTEFLPISSTGHLIVVGELIGLPDVLENTFEIVIQVGAVIAVIGFYWSDLFTQLRTVRQDQVVQRLWLGIAIAFIPAAVLGLTLRSFITEVLFDPIVIGWALIGGGIVFLVVEHNGIADRADEERNLEDITLRQAFAVGLWQCFALIPGVSRSGASIIGGLFIGLNRRVATQFSFYLAIPTLGLATLYELATNFTAMSASSLLYLLVGIIISGVVAWLSIGWLLQYISKNNFIPFGYYRILVGIIILLVFYFR